MLKAFGKEAFKSVAYFNFDEQPDSKQFFELTKNVNKFLLSLVYGSVIKPESSWVIFDGFQESKPGLMY